MHLYMDAAGNPKWQVLAVSVFIQQLAKRFWQKFLSHHLTMKNIFDKNRYLLIHINTTCTNHYIQPIMLPVKVIRDFCGVLLNVYLLYTGVDLNIIKTQSCMLMSSLIHVFIHV